MICEFYCNISSLIDDLRARQSPVSHKATELIRATNVHEKSDIYKYFSLKNFLQGEKCSKKVWVFEGISGKKCIGDKKNLLKKIHFIQKQLSLHF